MTRGKFIVVYGMNNLGKTTQTQQLCQHFQEKGIKAKYLKYPIYDLEPTGTLINGYLRNGGLKDLSPLEIQAIYSLNRRDYEPTLKKDLEEGYYVFGEDYNGTGLAWGIIFGADKNTLLRLNQGLLEPDLELLFDGERFLMGKEGNHAHEGLPDEDWRRGRKIHQELAKEFGWQVIDANGTKNEVFTRLLKEIENSLPLREGTFPGKERFA